jgi:hypothetical protein
MRLTNNEIIALVGERPPYDLGESVGPDLRLGELLNSTELPGLANLPLGYDRGDEAITTSPLFPTARSALDFVGANVTTLPLSFDRGYIRDRRAEWTSEQKHSI